MKWHFFNWSTPCTTHTFILNKLKKLFGIFYKLSQKHINSSKLINIISPFWYSFGVLCPLGNGDEIHCFNNCK
jgi:hypothetical protein